MLGVITYKDKSKIVPYVIKQYATETIEGAETLLKALTSTLG